MQMTFAQASMASLGVLVHCSQALRMKREKNIKENNFVVTSYKSLKTQRPRMVRKTTNSWIKCVKATTKNNLLNSQRDLQDCVK
jgi:hypothetical protein